MTRFRASGVLASIALTGVLLSALSGHGTATAATATAADTRAEKFTVLSPAGEEWTHDELQTALDDSSRDGWTVRATVGRHVILVKGR